MADNIQQQDRFARSSSGDQITIIIPIYNEGQYLSIVLAKLNKFLAETTNIKVVFVESNSSDGSREVLLKTDFSFENRIILQSEPRGKGFAIREALSNLDNGIIAIFDSDDEYKIEDLQLLVNEIQSGRCSFALGRRPNHLTIRSFEDQVVQSFLMNIGHQFFTHFFNLLFKTKFKDPVTMWKVFRFEAIRDLNFYSNRFDFDFEILAKCVRNGSKPIEIPVSYRSRSFKQGKKIRPIKDSISWIICLPKFKFEKL
jgi:glycosyltransferase involved in cell wall biosynthesis